MLEIAHSTFAKVFNKSNQESIGAWHIYRNLTLLKRTLCRSQIMCVFPSTCIYDGEECEEELDRCGIPCVNINASNNSLISIQGRKNSGRKDADPIIAEVEDASERRGYKRHNLTFEILFINVI